MGYGVPPPPLQHSGEDARVPAVETTAHLEKDFLLMSTDHENALIDAEPLQSGELFSPADGMLGLAITETLEAPPAERLNLFSQLILRIEEFMAQHPEERPWTCTRYSGTDGSSIFRGGLGLSMVIDSHGRLWRGRNYEDFETTYVFTEKSCEIDTLTPLYTQMREYLRR